MQKKNHIALIILALLGCVLLVSFASSVNAAAQVTILSHSGYISSLGWYYVVGEVQNSGDMHLKYVEITATFYDSYDVVVDTSFTFADLNVLLVGRKSPFKLTLFNTEQSAKVDHYSLAVTYDIFELGKPQGLEILSSSSYVDTLGWMHVVGEIKNIGVYPTTYVEVIATFYDNTGKVVGCGFTFSNPSDFEADQKASFEIILMSDRVPLVDSYEITAESDQYAVIPEFPSFLILPVFMVAILLAIVVYKKIDNCTVSTK